MDDEDQHKYQRIDLATDAIRIVRLLSGRQEDPIRCELIETFLHQVHGVPYEALSYCWGKCPRAYEVFVNERKKHVNQNLYMALLALRQPYHDRLLWIDAICIDQDNHKEKGHQVGQMRQVYENAEQVLIWLGPSSCEIDSLLELVRRWDLETRQRPEAHIAKGWIDLWIRLTNSETVIHGDWIITSWRNALQDILARSWFRRVWILQEVASAKRATILCGSKAIPSRGFGLLPFLLKVELDSHTEAVLAIFPGYRRKETWWGKTHNLETLLLKFRRSKATDHRDKIYALLGMASDARASKILRPDYEVSLGRAICHTISFLLFGEAYDPSARPLPEDMDFATFIRILPKLSDYTLGWALRADHDVTAAAVVPKAVDINRFYLIPHIAPVPGRSPLSWIMSSSAKFSRTLCAIMERNDVDVLFGEKALLKSVNEDQPEAVKLLVQRPSAVSSGLTMRDAETLLTYAAASADRESFERLVSILTSPNPVSAALKPMMNRAIHDGTRNGNGLAWIEEWLFDYLKPLQGRTATDSFAADMDRLFKTLATQHNKYHYAPTEYLAMVLLVWKHRAKGDSLSFERIRIKDPYKSLPEPWKSMAMHVNGSRPTGPRPWKSMAMHVLINGEELSGPEADLVGG